MKNNKNEVESLQMNLDVTVDSTSNIIDDVSKIIHQSQRVAYQAVDIVLLKRNWLIGKRIYEEELKETRRENYGLEIIRKLSRELVNRFGKGFSSINLYRFYKFYILYKKIFSSVMKESFLTWTHYSVLISINNQKARDWYEKEALRCTWSVRTLQRNINSQYYYRLLSSQVKEPVIKEMENNSSEYEIKKLEHIKNPLILDFLGIKQEESLLETKLESLIINNIQNLLIELGKGYAFVGRQYHIRTIETDYYIDLVFYNYILKCFVLVDLKTNKISYEDVGQMDMYVKMFDESIKGNDDNSTLGIILCSDTNMDVARYSVLKGSEQLFASKYKLYLPS